LISTTRKVAVALIALTLATVATAGAATSHSRQAYAESGPSLSLLASRLPQPFDDQVAPAIASPPAAPKTYVIAQGDTLSTIAARFCGSSSRYPNLAAASGIGNYDLIFTGGVVTLDCAAVPKAPAAKPSPAPQHAVAAVARTGTGKAASVVAYVLAQVGRPYVWGTAGPRAFDCSGLVVAAFSRIGISLPHQSESLLSRGTPVSRANLQPGDVIWPYHGHVMIYVGNGRIVEAANPQQGVRSGDLYGFMAARRFV
jgi:peptidoglycan DL-endopeptidase CwlO